jgi:serine/threonine protein kinase/tetratricopeptide (TPR) repeat protein
MPLSLSKQDEVAARNGRKTASSRANELDELDGYVHAFERAWADRGWANLAEFLPTAGHRLYSSVLRELVRVDLEYGWEQGRPRSLDEYRRAFPTLEADHEGFREVAFEEYRLRRQAGLNPSSDEYLCRYGVAMELEPSRSWHEPPASPSSGASAMTPNAMARTAVPVAALEPSPAALSLGTGHDRSLHLPVVGEEFLGFRLVGELGQGSFGRVYLARQGDMADRPVVLKVTADARDESQTLAQLRHENIVPVYSRHRSGSLRAVCMPYLGSVTFRDVLLDMKRQDALPCSGRDLLGSLSTSSARRSVSGVAPACSPVVASRESGVGNGSGSWFGAWIRAGAGREKSRVHGDGPFPGSATDRGGSAAAPDGLPLPASEVPSTETLTPRAGTDSRSILGGLSYVEAVVWLAARLADGLSHAHDRGILHRDLKPANILLTDDGRPMLLDFNLAADMKRDRSIGTARVGGTLPYMAPEQIEAFRSGGRSAAAVVDARSDLYGFGVIVYEMLIGRPPFPAREGLSSEVLRGMVADRQGEPPRLRRWNPAVSPAVESIVRRCLEPDPSRRYASARELVEDLERHLQHKPLLHAPDPSRRERAVKWVRRHPRWVAGTALLLMISVVGAVAAAAVAGRDRQLARHEAVEALRYFQERSRDAQYLLDGYRDDPLKRPEGLSAAKQALAAFHVLDVSPSEHPQASALRNRWPGVGLAWRWWDRPPASQLTAGQRETLRRDVGTLLLLLAWAEIRDGRPRAALDANERAEPCFGASGVPRALWAQRSELLTRLRDREGSLAALHVAANTPLTAPRDFYLAGCEASHHGEDAAAVNMLTEATRLAPDDYWAWLTAGICHYRLLDDAAALRCFDVCVALRLDQPAGWYNRALVSDRQGRYVEAIRDLDEALRLRPSDQDFMINRALAALRLGRRVEAIDGFTRVIERGSPYARVYFMRAEAREGAGDLLGARSDREEGLRHKPADELSCVTRADYRAHHGDPPGALDDLDAALALNPESYLALHHKAGVLSDLLGRPEAAVEILNRLAGRYPDHLLTRLERGVLLARLSRRDEALADASWAMNRDRSGETDYRAACVFALTSRQTPGDRAEALRLLSSALSKGFGRDVAATDPDLSPIRDDPEFATRLLPTSSSR